MAKSKGLKDEILSLEKTSAVQEKWQKPKSRYYHGLGFLSLFLDRSFFGKITLAGCIKNRGCALTIATETSRELDFRSTEQNLDFNILT